MLLIITSCIRVNEKVPFVSIRDEELRLKEYLKTIKWAVEETPFNEVIFCDNSGFENEKAQYELDRIKASCEKNNKIFEYYSFQGNSEMVAKKGKGFGEGEIISYVYDHSPTMRYNKFFYKITGRLKIANIRQLIYPNILSTNIMNISLSLKRADTRFYMMRMRDYEKYFKDAYMTVNDYEKRYLEHVYYEILFKYKIPVRDFYKAVHFQGTSGSLGVEYEDISEYGKLREIFNHTFLFRTYTGRKIRICLRNFGKKDENRGNF